VIPWENLGEGRTPSGQKLTLHRRGEEFSIRIDREELMNSRQHGSEDSLSTMGCEHLVKTPKARVLIGGLGLGYTLRAALDVLGRDAEVEVAELVSAVVEWNRGPVAHLAGRPLEDPRTKVREGDVVELIASSRGRYDAILLDTDNGPDAFVTPGNQRLYGPAGLKRAAEALRPRGVLGVWSVADDDRFTSRLQRAGYHVRVERVLARHNGNRKTGKTHVLWLAQKRE
jgi:spermidine synthase